MVHGNVTTQPLQWQAEETNLSPSKSKFSCTFEDGKKKKKKMELCTAAHSKFHVSTAIIRMTNQL